MDVVRTLIFLAILAGLIWWLSKRFARPGTASRQAPASTLTESEAREILGVTPHASREEIINQHRKLMQKVHPDTGGSTYLAQQLNEAKRVLLENR